jgi:hypothetical protein
MNRSEANHFIGGLLETSAIAFGVRDRRSPHLWFAPGEQTAIAHYIGTQTCGQYLDASPETYASAVADILQQPHFRYELGFKPEVLDGSVLSFARSSPMLGRNITRVCACDTALLMCRFPMESGSRGKDWSMVRVRLDTDATVPGTTRLKSLRADEQPICYVWGDQKLAYSDKNSEYYGGLISEAGGL